jgi:hypothetical protein
VLDTVELHEDDVVIAMTDGVVDNLWEHEVVTNVCESMEKWRNESQNVGTEEGKDDQEQSYADGMRFVAQRLVNAAREIAEDPFAESPYMEKAIDEGLSIEGGMFSSVYKERSMVLTLSRQARRYQRGGCSVQETQRLNGDMCA